MSSFPGEASLAEIAAVIGDPGRARMLMALLGGEALPAGELAWQAGVSPSTASGHLAQLVRSGLLAVLRQGRHRYYRLATPDVARLLETMLAVAATQAGPRHRPESPRDAALRQARTCYDHLAGRLGVVIADGLVAAGHLTLGWLERVPESRAVRLTSAGGEGIGRAIGLDPAPFFVAPAPSCGGQSAVATTSSSSWTS